MQHSDNSNRLPGQAEFEMNMLDPNSPYYFPGQRHVDVNRPIRPLPPNYRPCPASTRIVIRGKSGKTSTQGNHHRRKGRKGRKVDPTTRNGETSDGPSRPGPNHTDASTNPESRSHPNPSNRSSTPTNTVLDESR